MKRTIYTLIIMAVTAFFAVQSYAGVDPYAAYQNRMQLYTSQFYMTIDSLDALTRKLDSLIAGQNADTAGVSAVAANLAILQTTADACSTYTDGVEGNLAILQTTADACSVAVSTTLPATIQTAREADSTALAKAQDSLNYLVAGNDDIFTLVDSAAWRGWIPFLSGATSLPSETTDTIATVTGDVRIAILGFRVTTALEAEYVKLGFWARNTDGVAAETALCDSAGMTDLTGSAAGVALNLTGVFANNPTVTAFNVAAVSGEPTVMRLKNCAIIVGCATTVTSSGKVQYFMLWQPISTGSRVTTN